MRISQCGPSGTCTNGSLRRPGCTRRCPPSGHAARVALAATLLVWVVYAGVTILDRAVTARLVASVDARLREHLADTWPAKRVTRWVAADRDLKARPDDDLGVHQAPVFLAGPARQAA